MDKHQEVIMDKKLEVCIKNLKLHQFDVSVLASKAEVNPFLESVIAKGSVVAVGGSQTIRECDTLTWLRSGYVNFIDRYDPKADISDCFHKGLLSDVFLTSSNAVTIEGELVNVDDTGNRVAAMIYGPKKVYVIVGLNKLVSDIEDAVHRIDTIAAPMNCERLNKDTPCRKVGECVNCNVPQRICSETVVMHRSYTPQRIHIVFVKENLGY